MQRDPYATPESYRPYELRPTDSLGYEPSLREPITREDPRDSEKNRRWYSGLIALLGKIVQR